MNRKLPVLWAAAAVFFSSCWHPPFDPLVSASEFTVERLGSPVWSSTATLWDQAEGGYYLPSRNPEEYATGAWIRKKDGIISIGKLALYGNGKFDFNANRYNAPDTFGNSTVLASPPGSNGTDPVLYVGSNPDGIYQLNMYNDRILPASSSLIGLGVVPSDSGSDLYYLAERTDPTITITYIGMNSGTVFPVLPLNGTLVNPSPIPVGPAFFAGSPADISSYYLSGPMAGGAVETYCWTSTAALPVLLPVPLKLTGILSDGRLLADTGEKLTVYSAEGVDGFSIPTGLLRFVHERISPDGVWHSVFTRTIQTPGDDDGDGSDYLIEIYEIPTADLRTLAE